MAIKKSLFVTGAVATIGLASLSGAALVAAESANPGDTLAQKIAQKFNLNEAEVKAVIQENREEHKQEHKQQIEEELTQAVSDGKITEEQKTKLLAKLEEMHKNRQENKDELKDMTKGERRQQMETKKAEMKQWLKDNGIPEDIMESIKPVRGHHGPGAMMNRSAQ